MSIAAPATNPASDLSLKLPATVGTAGQVLKNSSTPGTLEFGGLGGGITQVDQWQQTTDFDSSDQTLTSNWARSDATASGSYQNFGRIGTGMSESSGIFTFPSTGIWRVEFMATARHVNYQRRFLTGRILITKDNSTYRDAVWPYTSIYTESPETYATSLGITLVDVTSTTNCKVKFGVTSDGSMTWMADSSYGTPYTFAIFTRLGDT